MHRRMAFCFIMLLLGLAADAQTVNLQGKVTNQAGKPISKAVVALIRQGLFDTTGDDGMYSIMKDVVATLPPLVPHTDRISLTRSILELGLPEPSSVKVEVFDIQGHLLKKDAMPIARAGVYRLNIAECSPAVNLLVIKASIGRHAMTFRYFRLQNGNFMVNRSVEQDAPSGGRLAKIAADVDSLKVTVDGYTTKVVPVSSYEATVNITLDTVKTTSDGCGRANHPSSGKTTIKVDGTSRQYMLKIPANYDAKKPYKLVFCWHWLNGSYDDVINNGYYGLEKLSNGTAIFVAPNGISNGWANTNGRDINFLKAMLAYFDSTLCIDKERIFSLGWSYGGMMSFAIACAQSHVFRAIAPMSGAIWSGCDESDKANIGPIAMWQSHGNNDGTVSLSAGKQARDFILKRNGCGTQTKPVDPSPCVEYQGCEEGYPVIYCEFNGGHEQPNFATNAIWKFFSQF